MEIAIILSVAATIILFFIYVSKSGEKMIALRQERISRAQNGKAKILSFSSFGTGGNGQQGRFQVYSFRIVVSNGYSSPYETTAAWAVYNMGSPNVQKDMTVDVKIDADDPMTVYPLVPGVEYSWTGSMILKKRK